VANLKIDYDNIEKILDTASKINETLVDVAPFLPIGQSTINMLESIIAPYNDAIGMAVEVYGDLGKVISALGAAGKIVEIFAERDLPMFEARKKPNTKLSMIPTSSPTSISRSSTSTTLATVATPAVPTSGTSPTHTNSISLSSTPTTTTSSSTPTFTPHDIPESQLSQWVQHHWLNRTTGGKNFTVNILKSALKAQLQSPNMTTTASLKSFIPNTLASMNMSSIQYPPTADAHRQAISHQIATGNATAYNKANMAVRVVMDANAPQDPCLGLQKLSCFGNQVGEPYCRFECAGRWYNRMNVVVEHW
jgi:hypothetical protein